jgi:hypothetical protein
MNSEMSAVQRVGTVVGLIHCCTLVLAGILKIEKPEGYDWNKMSLERHCMSVAGWVWVDLFAPDWAHNRMAH